MSLAIRPLHPVFVGEVSGVDLTKPLGERHPRDMRRTTVAGDGPTVAQAA